MADELIDARWRALTKEVTQGMYAWRAAHPRATLREIETALDERWATTRTQLLEAIALASQEVQVTSGIHWGRANLNPLVCLRALL